MRRLVWWGLAAGVWAVGCGDGATSAERPRVEWPAPSGNPAPNGFTFTSGGAIVSGATRMQSRAFTLVSATGQSTPTAQGVSTSSRYAIHPGVVGVVR